MNGEHCVGAAHEDGVLSRSEEASIGRRDVGEDRRIVAGVELGERRAVLEQKDRLFKTFSLNRSIQGAPKCGSGSTRKTEKFSMYQPAHQSTRLSLSSS